MLTTFLNWYGNYPILGTIFLVIGGYVIVETLRALFGVLKR